VLDILNHILVLLDKIEVKGAENVVTLSDTIRYVIGARQGIMDRTETQAPEKAPLEEPDDSKEEQPTT
jgi:hypothetical protein